MRYQRPAAERQQRFVPAHPGALAARQHVPGPAHREMIPLTGNSHLGARRSILAKGLKQYRAKMFYNRLHVRLRGCGLPRCGRARGVRRAAPTRVRDGWCARSSASARLPVRARYRRRPWPKPSTGSPVQNQLPSRLVHSVIQVESNYDPNAVSPKGALGLMQLIPATARRFGVSDVFDPEDNIEGGTRYLKYLLGLYKGDESLALAAYNAGEGAVSRYGGIPPYPETLGYVAKVRQRLAGAPDETGAAPAAVQTDGAQSANALPLYNPIREVRDANGRVYYTSQ